MGLVHQIGRIRVIVSISAVAIVVVAWLQIVGAGSGLVSRSFERNGVPLRYLGPQGGTDVPGVVIAHGFSGSRQLMLAYGYTLAQNGYGVMLLDFTGHAANRTRSTGAGDRAELIADLLGASDALRAEPAVDANRIALLGHSMGSGVVLEAGVDDPELARAVVAISPGNVAVDETRPPNLLLQAGELEAPFADRARALFEQAEGPNDDFAAGTARGLLIIPGVEHITILFSPASHESALSWLNATFERQSAETYRDTRMLWFVAQLVAWLVLAVAVAPIFASARPNSETRRSPWHWVALLGAPFVATGLLYAVGQVVDLGGLLGVAVGGALGLWFAFFGVLWLWVGFRPKRPIPTALLWGGALFGIYWLAFGLPAHVVWLPWLLIPERLVLWPVLLLACLPWQLAAGYVQHGVSWWRRAAWWLLQSVVIVAGVLLAVALMPELGFMFLIAPVIPLVLGIMTVLGGVVDRPWAVGLGNAAFFGWLILTLFPLVA